MASDLDIFLEYIVKLLNNELRTQMGINAFNYLKKEYDVQISYEKIVQKIK